MLYHFGTTGVLSTMKILKKGFPLLANDLPMEFQKLMKNQYSLIVLAIFSLHPAMAAQALPSGKQDNVITVTAPVVSPMMMSTSPKLPRQPVPASDGADYLKTIPGFSVVRNGGTNGDPVFRGMADSRLRILANGAEMLGACPNRMDAPTSYISPEEFDVLTVIKGPETVLWGPGNSAGTILFEREPPQFDKPGQQGTITALAGANHRYDTNADLSIGNQWGYLRLLGSKSHATDYKDGSGHRVHAGWDKWDTDIELGFTPDEDKLIQLSAGTGDGKASYAARNMDGVEFRRKSLGLKFQWNNIGEVFDKLEGQINYNYARHSMDNYSLRPLPVNGMRHIMPFDRRTISERLMGTWKWTTLKLEAGVDGESYTHRNIPGMMYNPNKISQPGFIKDARYENYGLFGQISWYASSDNTLIAGARLDHTQMTHVSGQEKKRTDTLPAGFMRIEHQFAGDEAMVYAGLGYVERFPDYWELLSNDNQAKNAIFSGTRLVVPVDPFNHLKSEKTTQLDIGAQYKGNAFSAWASAYAGYLNDFILFKFGTKGKKEAKAAGNINAHIMGAEAGLSYQLTKHVKTDTSLSWSYGENITHSQPLPQMPPLEARFSATYEQHGVSGTLLWRVVSRQNRVALKEGNLVGQDLQQTAGFGVLSANLAYKINSHIQISAGVDNLFNKTYSEHLNKSGAGIPGYVRNFTVTEPGRTWWGKLNVTF